MGFNQRGAACGKRDIWVTEKIDLERARVTDEAGNLRDCLVDGSFDSRGIGSIGHRR